MECYRDLILARNCVFIMKHIEIRKSFMAYRPPPLCQQKLLPVYVFTYFAKYMKVACWHKGGEGYSLAQKPVIEQIKMLCLSNKK